VVVGNVFVSQSARSKSRMGFGFLLGAVFRRWCALAAQLEGDRTAERPSESEKTANLCMRLLRRAAIGWTTSIEATRHLGALGEPPDLVVATTAAGRPVSPGAESAISFRRPLGDKNVSPPSSRKVGRPGAAAPRRRLSAATIDDR
jgi:hypothetical protein